MEKIDTIQCLKEKKIKKEKMKNTDTTTDLKKKKIKKEYDRNRYHTMIKVCYCFIFYGHYYFTIFVVIA